MTRYYVHVSGELADEITPGDDIAEGFRLVSKFSDVPGYERTECWLAEDDGAPAYLEGTLVVPSFRNDYDEESNVVRTFVSSRDR